MSHSTAMIETDEHARAYPATQHRPCVDVACDSCGSHCIVGRPMVPRWSWQNISGFSRAHAGSFLMRYGFSGFGCTIGGPNTIPEFSMGSSSPGCRLWISRSYHSSQDSRPIVQKPMRVWIELYAGDWCKDSASYLVALPIGENPDAQVAEQNRKPR